MDRFAEILFDLGKEMKADFCPDEHRICQLNYDDQLHIQIHYEDAKERLLITTMLTDVPPGKYREKLLRAGLIHNTGEKRAGTLAFSEKNNKLAHFFYISARNIKIEVLHKKLTEFIDEGIEWKEAIEKGNALPVNEGKGPSNQQMFGLKP